MARVRQPVRLIAAALTTGACVAHAAPVTEPWPAASSGPASAVATAELSGWYAAAETAGDTVEIRDIRGDLLRTITRAEISALAPWMTLDASADGPSALAWTDSGRGLFIVVTDAAPSTDGLGSDVVLRYDTATDALTRFVRAEIGDASGPPAAAMHFRGELWIATQAGPVRVYRAGRGDAAGVLRRTWSAPANAPARGFAVARRLDLAFVVTDDTLFRIDLSQTLPDAQPVGPVTRGTAVAYSDHTATPEFEGVYLAEGAAPGVNARLRFIPRPQAIGQSGFAPFPYLTLPGDVHALSATACGRMMLASDAGPAVLRETDDPRLGFEDWLRDEFDQVLVFARGLVSADGRPEGWVTDADVAAGATRFHPPSPDGAAWTIMLQIADDHLANNQASADTVRVILRRYAGLMPDGIAPIVSADGIMHHWHNPFTGGAAPGWDPEFATMSTMLLVMAADRARRFYPGNTGIVEAADTIIGRIENWEDYLNPSTRALYLRAQPTGGPDFGTASGAFNEGVLFVEQAAVYGQTSQTGPALDFWLNRNGLPEAAFIPGQPVTTDRSGEHLPAFVSLYPWIAQQ